MKTRELERSGQARIRRNRLAGDRFVRGLMEDLNVRVDPDAARLVIDASQRAFGEEDEDATPRPSLNADEVRMLRW